MSNEILPETIYKTESGRRFYIKDYAGYYGGYSCGYIEIDKDMPKDYDNKVYEDFDFWGGPTFLGICFPSFKGTGEGISHADATIWKDNSFLKGLIENPTFEDVIANVKEEYREELSKSEDYFWVIGYDDNHIEKCYDVPDRTKHIAEQIDEWRASHENTNSN